MALQTDIDWALMKIWAPSHQKWPKYGMSKLALEGCFSRAIYTPTGINIQLASDILRQCVSNNQCKFCILQFQYYHTQAIQRFSNTKGHFLLVPANWGLTYCLQTFTIVSTPTGLYKWLNTAGKCPILKYRTMNECHCQQRLWITCHYVSETQWSMIDTSVCMPSKTWKRVGSGM